MKYQLRTYEVDAVQITEALVLRGTLPKPARRSASSVYPIGHAQYPEGKVIYFNGVIEREGYDAPERFELGDWLVTTPDGVMKALKPDAFAAMYQPAP